MAIDLYGIRNCSTVKKARAWLDEHGVTYVFHDYKIEGADPELLQEWCGEFGWGSVLNRAGTSFRNLPPADKEGLDVERAIALMLAHPSTIKRPIVDIGTRRLLGFKPEAYAAAFMR